LNLIYSDTIVRALLIANGQTGFKLLGAIIFSLLFEMLLKCVCIAGNHRKRLQLQLY